GIRNNVEGMQEAGSVIYMCKVFFKLGDVILGILNCGNGGKCGIEGMGEFMGGCIVEFVVYVS
uniref:hypothetical protein n=1 Tax=Bacillus velezensis TaxID=492670 RepID=UPI001C930B55